MGNALRHKLEVVEQRSLAFHYTLTTVLWCSCSHILHVLAIYGVINDNYNNIEISPARAQLSREAGPVKKNLRTPLPGERCW